MQSMRERSREMPLACTPDAIPAEDRSSHFALLLRLFDEAVEEKRAVDRGYAYRFPAESFDDIARFISHERRCCPFLGFDVEVSPEGGPVWLRLTGPEGTREFLDTEFRG